MSDTPKTMASALRVLAGDIQAPDDVPAMCLRDAANMLEQLEQELAAARAAVAKADSKHVPETNFGNIKKCAAYAKQRTCGECKHGGNIEMCESEGPHALVNNCPGFTPKSDAGKEAK